MYQKENVSPSVAALGETAETEATFEQATTSKNYFTTNYDQRQTGEISQFLLCGAENAIPRRELMSGYSDRGLRLQIEAKRRQGIPILSDNQHGYFMPGSEEERLHCVRSLRSRAAEVEASYRKGGAAGVTGDIFDTTKRLVSARSAAEYYGFQPNRANFISCPFHTEKTASLKLFDDGGWHCFGCNQGGSSVDFVTKLFDLSALDAVRKMNVDFNLSLPLNRPPNKEQQEAAQQRHKLQLISVKYEQWRDNLSNQLNEAYRIGHQVLLNCPDKLTEQEILAVKWHNSLEYWSDLLLSGNLDKQMEVFRDKKDVEELCNRILKSTQMKSNVA